MRLLLDTHILLWWLTNNQRLSEKATLLIENQRHAVFVSSASIWEIAVKRAIGKIDADLDQVQQAIITNEFEALPITIEHVAAVSALPMFHRDPFDRILLAQCLVESTQLLTSDNGLKAYGKIVINV